MKTKSRKPHDPSPWNESERRILAELDTPWKIQGFLDATPYSCDPIYRSPRRVMADRRAHCVDGALMAAAALRRLGHRPVVLDLMAERDDDHVIAVFQRGKRYGAVAKSNCTGLRFREPIHRSLRELAMSYFDDYFNTKGERSLRSYSLPLDLTRFDRLCWTTEEGGLEAIVAELERRHHVPLLTPADVRLLTPTDERSFRAGFLDSNPDGLFQP